MSITIWLKEHWLDIVISLGVSLIIIGIVVVFMYFYPPGNEIVNSTTGGIIG